MRGRIAAQLLLVALMAGCDSLTTQEYTSPDGRYRARFPGTPKIQHQMVPTPAGPVTAAMAISEEGSRSLRMVMYADYPATLVNDGNKGAILDGFCGGWSQKIKATVRSQAPTAIAGHPGRELRFEMPDVKGRGRTRVYLVGRRIYQVMILGTDVSDGTMQGFLDSFALLGGTPPPTGPELAAGPVPPPIGPTGVAPPGRPGGPPGKSPMGPRSGPGGPASPNFPAGPRRLVPPSPPGGLTGPRWAGPGIPTGPRSVLASPPVARDAPRTGSTTPAAESEPGPPADRTLAFYDIPEPASAPIEVDIPGPGPKPGAIGAHSPLLIPAGPGTDEAPEPRPQRKPRPRPEPAPPPRPSAGGQGSNEIPTFLIPTSGGASIVAFDWLGRDDDYVGTDGRRIAPGGGKDEHFRLALALPPAAIIQEITIIGGGDLRWTTRASARVWPIAVVANRIPRNRGQSLSLGPFSGSWTLDLYAESHETVRPGQDFGVEVVVLLGGKKHQLSARCRRA